MAQSYFLTFDPKLERAGQPVPPLGSLICAAVLRDRGFEVSFFDAMVAASESDCAVLMDRVRPAALVIFEDNFNYLSKMCLGRMREAAATMIGMARARGIEVIVAGSDASDDPRFFLDAGALAVAKGEGELTVADWLEADPGSRFAVSGVVSVADGGDLRVALPRPPIRDLDALPSPAWDLIDLEAYRRVWMDQHGRFSLPLATSRGCPFHCNWCAKPIWGQRYNTQSPSRAAREVRTLKGLGATHVNILDDIFGLKPGWTEAFAAELRALDAVLPFKCLSRADLLSVPAIEALVKAGCEMVWVGAESGSQAILDAMEKGATVEAIRTAARELRRNGVKVGFFIQFGYPGESQDDIEATIRLIEEVLPEDIGISVSYPLPGTRFHERVRHEMGERLHWRDSNDLAMLFEGRHETRYYRWLHSYTHARFRLARSLRAGEAGSMRGLVRIARYGSLRAIARVALSLTSRARLGVRHWSPELSRGAAATPFLDPAGPGEA